MKYDPVKNIFARIIDQSTLCRSLFYHLLDLMILRQLHVKKNIKKYFHSQDQFVFYDAGAGFCQYTDFILKHYPHAQIVSMDLKTDYMQSYQKSLKTNSRPISIFQGDLQSFVCPEKVDLVIAIDILEHIKDDLSVLKNFFQAMNNNATLIISTPSNMDKAAAFTEEHVRPGYSVKELSDKLKQTGFSLVDIHYSYGFWGKLYWVLGMKIPLQIVSLSKFLLILLPFYFLVVLPFNLIFMQLDLCLFNQKGNGIICVAKKD